MAATNTALNQFFGTGWDNAWYEPSNPAAPFDVLQIVDAGQGVVLNVDHAGVVHNPASGATSQTRMGVFQTNLASGDTTAHYFANAFSNPSNLDIIQIINEGGSVVKFLDFQGVSH